jgi:hypothetical protein
MNKISACACIVWLACANAAHAQHSVSLLTEVDRIENPLLSSVSPGGVTVFRVAPSYTYEFQGERSQSRFSAGAVLERSGDTALLASRNYPSMGYTWTYLWPTGQLQLRTSLAEAASRNSELRDLGRVTTDTRERTVLAGAEWDQELTARTRLVLNATNTRVKYDSVLLEGYGEQAVSTRWLWEASERTSYFFQPSYSQLKPSGDSEESSQTRWLLGTRVALSPGWSLTAHAGQARIGSSRNETGTLGLLQLEFSGSQWSAGVDVSKDVVAGGVAADYVETEALGLRAGYQIAEGTRVSASFTRSQSRGVAGGRGSVTALSFERELGAQWTLTARIEDRRSTDGEGSSGRGWAARAGVTYAFPGR